MIDWKKSSATIKAINNSISCFCLNFKVRLIIKSWIIPFPVLTRIRYKIKISDQIISDIICNLDRKEACLISMITSDQLKRLYLQLTKLLAITFPFFAWIEYQMKLNYQIIEYFQIRNLECLISMTVSNQLKKLQWLYTKSHNYIG